MIVLMSTGMFFSFMIVFLVLVDFDESVFSALVVFVWMEMLFFLFMSLSKVFMVLDFMILVMLLLKVNISRVSSEVVFDWMVVLLEESSLMMMFIFLVLSVVF